MGYLADPFLLESILKAIETYNNYRSPEATAKFVEFSKNNLVIKFEGIFCQSCGVQDYFDDFIYELYEIIADIKIKIDKIEPLTPQSFRVQYTFEKNTESGEEHLFREFLQEKGMSYAEYMKSNACTKDVILFHFRTWKSQLT
jgi:hypothetical protein